ncbi:response regulator transcription factor [Sulfurimonas sp. HSL-1716]|uniref:response regulator transcription factor n=1 Tax=Hydrocurvibacter sulfurireducens TaxID=3131937 RepID=UPI0031F85143
MKILIIEDDDNITSFIVRGLRENGHILQSAQNGDEGEYLALTHDYDVIILDWMLPQKSGIDVLHSLREKHISTPVLMLSAKGDVKDKITGLKQGADDYLGKPFSFDELEARIEALYRRSLGTSGDHVTVGGIVIDPAKKQVTKDSQTISLTSKEYELLLFLLKHRGNLVSNAMIEEQLWTDEEFLNSNVIQVTMYNLKKKIGKELIKNHRGLGYTLEDKA